MQPVSNLVRRIFWSLIAILALQASFARAEMLGPEAVLSQQPATLAELEREKVKHFLDTTALQDKLRALGVDGLNASARVDAMTPQEVHALAQRIDAMPAGGAFSDRDIILILLVALLLVVVL
ncbi:hypothetical protein EZ313_22965 [Ramlibacter henchirensis]|uniref:PA2779 family protein n=1 Tax=Ramlibacter henchirensis TaxID=204072 RepID=A0A4Z0BKX8_9BURK|nr:PA2779 family protein [Ramlibacter henchirensis]TFY99411.1 hypothetical protein EZ313_22965 [Ramlibacter henchirensis]